MWGPRPGRSKYPVLLLLVLGVGTAFTIHVMLLCGEGGVAMEHVSPEMKPFLEACEILVHEMGLRDFSVKECNLIEHYSLELYVRYGSRRS
jgi:hypothetical protein